MRTSIALCTYNGMPWLPEQLRSLAAQSVLPDEVVVCDDGSTDETLSYLEELSTSAPFELKIHENPTRLGFAKNFEQAVSKCTGDVIFLCDQDDSWVATKLQKYLDEFARDSSISLVASNSLLVDPTLKSLGTTLWKRYRFSARRIARINALDCPMVETIKHYALLGHTLAFRRSVADALAPIGIAGHDYWTVLVASAYGRFSLIPECLTLYRIHAAQQSKGAIGESMLRDVGRQTQSQHFADKAAAFDDLGSRLEESAAHCELDALQRLKKSIEILHDKSRYMKERERLRVTSRRITRMKIISELFFDGSYHRLGRGLLSLGKDVLG